MKNKNFIKLSGIALMSIALCGCNNKSNPKSTFDIMFDNCRNVVIESTPTPDYENKTKEQILSEVEEQIYTDVLDAKNETYYFKDIDYTSKDKAKWPCGTHVTRALQIAVVGAKKNNNDLIKIAYKLSSYYLCNDFHNPNWWWEAIGIPRDFGDLAFFTYKMSTEKEKQRVLDIIHHGSFYYTPGTHTATGANLYDYAHITLKSAVLAQNEEELASVNQYLLPGIDQDKEESFQSDGTFFQHGRMIQSGSYGRQGIIRLSKIAAAYTNTGIEAFPQDKLEIMMNFIVNGLKYLTHKGCFNYSVLGRTYTRPSALDTHGGTTDLGDLNCLKFFSGIENLPHREEFNQFLSDVANNKSMFNGIKYYPSCSLVVMNLDDVYLAFRGTNANAVNIEGINGENMLGYNLSYGTNTCVMETGKEYYNIAPLWDYSALPGTTAVSETDQELASYVDIYDFARKLEGTFNIGHPIDDDTNVICMQKTTHEWISYTVTCFATNSGMIILGSGLKNSSAEPRDLRTTVEQCFLNAEPSISPDRTLVKHGNVIYRSLDNLPFNLTTPNVIGSWTRNNNSYQGVCESRVMNITLNTNETKKYAYSIQPLSLANAEFTVANNNEDCHAIVTPDKKHILAAFYNDSTFEYEGHPYKGLKNEMKTFDIVE